MRWAELLEILHWLLGMNMSSNKPRYAKFMNPWNLFGLPSTYEPRNALSLTCGNEFSLYLPNHYGIAPAYKDLTHVS